MRRLLPLLALTLALPLVGCDSTTPEESITGVYALQTVNGNTLPWLAIQIDADKIEVLSGTISLKADGTFIDRTSYVVTERGVATPQDDIYTGTFVKTPTGATLSPLGFDVYTVLIDGSKMSQMIGEFELIYKK